MAAHRRLFTGQGVPEGSGWSGRFQKGPAKPRGSRGNDRDVARLVRALRIGSGHVVVTARDVDRAEALVEEALVAAEPYRVLRISATTEGIASLADDLLAFAADGAAPVGKPPVKASSPISALIEEARGAARPVVVVVTDADLASVKRLDGLRVKLEAEPRAIEVVRIVLIGCPVLSRILDLPSARGLSSRVGLQVRLDERPARRNT